MRSVPRRVEQVIAVMCEVLHGDCLDHLRSMPDNSVDAIVTDPPYGLSNTTPDKVADTIVRWASGEREHVPEGRGFMGRPWDAFVPPPAVWDECLRVLKPGGHMAVFAGSRTQDLMGMSIRLAGFELRDSLAWIYGSGFPKSMDVSKAIDKAAGAEREITGLAGRSGAGRTVMDAGTRSGDLAGDYFSSSPATPEAERWEGWGTALKPAQEPIILARKPLDGTVAANVLAHGVGGLNIDACRVETDDDLGSAGRGKQTFSNSVFGGVSSGRSNAAGGRFPANVLLDEHAAQEMDRQSGVSVSNVRLNVKKDYTSSQSLTPDSGKGGDRGHSDSGGASRFFPVFKYQAKAPKRERPVIEREDGTRVQHPTVKPLALMSWLVTLITPPGGVVLDPFAGSGTTLEAARDKGFRAVGIEADADHVALIHERLKQESGEPDYEERWCEVGARRMDQYALDLGGAR